MANTGVTKPPSARSTRSLPQQQGGMSAAEVSAFLGTKLAPIQEEYTTAIGELENRFKADINEYKTKIIEVLGIFVALFTFVSVDIQVFKTDISTLSAMGFSLVMLGALLLFIIVLVSIFDEKKSTILLNILALISVLLIIVGIISVGYDHKYTKERFYTKGETDKIISEKINSTPQPNTNTQNELTSLKTCLKSGGWNTCFK